MSGLPWAVPRYVVAGAAVQGARHLAGGQGCQDAFKAAPDEAGEAAVLAVADGAGSRDRSALGAHLAVDTACRILAEELPAPHADGALWSAWISGRGHDVVAESLRLAAALLTGDDTAPLAATLAACVFRPPWAAFLAVGDCTATVLTRDAPDTPERCHLVLPPPPPPPAFLYAPGGALRLRTFVLWDPALTGVVLATDGCTPMVLDHPSVRGLPPEAGPLPSARFFCSLAASLRANEGDAAPLHALLCGPDAERSGDDLTVLCALNRGVAA
ncbi:protein phosphatase 2C domain-containing protein [Streptomyces sp. NPDC051940]|uniref:protein phosphatase 2C domain-containing protein n=1 Tax=Streptomyces sp. NPDC051940 TaxID=3155675 RepID=UPI003427A7CE